MSVSIILSHYNVSAEIKTLNTARLKSNLNGNNVPHFNVGEQPSSLMISNAKKVYVTDFGSGDIYIIDPDTMQVSDVTANNFIANVLLHHPVAIDEVKGRIYVANYGSSSVSVIDGKNNTKIDDIPLIDRPTAMAIDNYNGDIYVASSGSDDVSVIDGREIILG